MQSPFDIYDIDTNKIIITTNKQIKIHQCEYMIVYSINLLEILTIILGGINNNGNRIYDILVVMPRNDA